MCSTPACVPGCLSLTSVTRLATLRMVAGSWTRSGNPCARRLCVTHSERFGVPLDPSLLITRARPILLISSCASPPFRCDLALQSTAPPQHLELLALKIKTHGVWAGQLVFPKGERRQERMLANNRLTRPWKPCDTLRKLRRSLLMEVTQRRILFLGS